MMRLLAVAAATVGVLAAGAVSAPASGAAEPERRVPVPVASVVGAPSPRLDQDTTQIVRATGVSRLGAITVAWGDGSTRSVVRSSCRAAQATARPAACAVTLSHAYDDAGTFRVVVRSGPRVIARTVIVVRAAAQPWTPPAGWVQPAGWAFFGRGATYVPCSTVAWHYDAAREPAGAVGMRAEIAGALSRLAGQTGLTFTETGDPQAAGLTYAWEDLTGRYAEAAGVGGRQGREGFVSFSTTHWWPTDQWPGYGIVTQPDGSYALGRGWLVVHETMHALGMDHVDDPTAIMHPIAGSATDFNAGDLDGLRTMYLANPCPV